MNPKELKHELIKIKEVIYVSLSASGNGVWGFVKVAYPAKLKQHFQQLVDDFSLMGIKLDKSKGGNPTDLRFYSYDPEPCISESFEIYTRLPKAKPIHKPRYDKRKSTGTSKDGVQTAVRLIERANDGQKHTELLKAAILAGGYIAAGTLSETEAVSMLENAIRTKANVESFENAQKTIKDGINYGKQAPIQQQIRQHYNSPLISVIGFFSRLNPEQYNVKLNGNTMTFNEFKNKYIPAAMAGDRTALKRLYKLQSAIIKDQQLMQSEAGKACLPAPVADAV